MSEKEQTQDMSKEEQIGFHKGSLSTLAKERSELLRMNSVVEQLMQLHVKALSDLGVDLTKESEEKTSKEKPKIAKKPIDEMI
ncbi:MAG TPA: hypothetical protein PLX15_01355 [Candidatus Woesearchaeota archaeon]|jgi:hypothetical protein|nr:hypothetical protein [Candidatus Woesearchaeota archaeon]